MRAMVWLLVVFLSIALHVGCAHKVPAPPPEPVVMPTPIQAPPTEPDWEQTWDRWIAAARKEGKIVVYTSPLPPDTREAISSGFKNRYGLDIEWVVGRGEETVRKIIAERQAGIYLCDIYFGGTTTFLLSLKPQGAAESIEPVLLLPEVKSPGAWFEGKLPFFDKDKQLFAFGMNISSDLAIFTREVRPEEVASYKDLLKPKFKGKIIMEDPTVPGGGLRWFGVVGEYLMNYDYIRELARQEIIITRDWRQMVEWTARGKTLVAISPHTDSVKEFASAGAPIKELNVAEGTYITSGGGNVALINKAPHPNTAKVFINWLLSKEGQLTYSKSRSLEVLRIDIPKDHLDPMQRYDPTRRIINTATEEYVLAQPEQIRKALEIFGHLVK